MIVRNVDAGWDVVFHEAHGLLAALIAESLYIEDDFPYWFSTKQAISIHDDQKVAFRWDARNYVTDAGAPKDFTLVSMDDATRVREAEACIRRATMKDRWIGLLVSFHNNVLYEGEETCVEMKSFLKDQVAWRRKTLAELRSNQAQLQQAYDWLQWCDRCSLLLCGNDVPAMERRVEITTHSNGQRFEIWQASNGNLQLAPWPFRSESVTVCWEKRTLKQLSFGDDKELQRALEESDVTFVTKTFKN